jgi:hypothetical protein
MTAITTTRLPMTNCGVRISSASYHAKAEPMAGFRLEMRAVLDAPIRVMAERKKKRPRPMLKQCAITAERSRLISVSA